MHPTDSGSITIVPLRLMPETAAHLDAGGIVSAINPHLMPETPHGFDAERHLKLAISDAGARDTAGHKAMMEQITRLIGFATAWDRTRPLVVHCFSGLNRSPAAAFIIVCALNPATPEALIAMLLRQASETAAPHRQMVVLADQLLGREGHMISAIDAIGPGLPAAEGKPFTLAATIGGVAVPVARRS